MNLCKDCKHFNRKADVQCAAPQNSEPDYVEGGMRYRHNYAAVARVDILACGPDAKWFKPTIVAKAAA